MTIGRIGQSGESDNRANRATGSNLHWRPASICVDTDSLRRRKIIDAVPAHLQKKEREYQQGEKNVMADHRFPAGSGVCSCSGRSGQRAEMQVQQIGQPCGHRPCLFRIPCPPVAPGLLCPQCTHHHADHVRGLERISAKYGIPSYVASDSPLKTLYERREFRPLREFDVDGVRFFPFPTFHDAAPSVGFFFLLDGVRFTIITDTGVLDERMFRAALKSDVLLLESNYCEELLESCCYPEFLKRRISSVYGHLSNRAAFDFLSRLREQPQCRLRQVYLCHLSEKSNTPERVEMLFSSLKDESFSITVCPKNQLIKGFCDDTIRKANSECFSCSNR